MAAAFPIVLAFLAVVTLLVPSSAEPPPPPAIAVERPTVYHPPVPYQPADDPSPTDVAAQSERSVVDPPATGEITPPDAPPAYFMPVEGVVVADVPRTFGDPRGSDRTHQGIDILAPSGTPVRAAAAGIVWRTSDSIRGGISVTVIGDDGVRYFYTHLDSIAQGMERDARVGTYTVLGYVGNTGNAAATAPHLHFEVSLPIEGERYSWRPIDPLLYMLDR